MWSTIFDAITVLTQREFDDVCRLRVNGDDLGLSIDYEKVSIKDVADYLSLYNVRISFDSMLPRFSHEITFLSHHLRTRFVRGYGDFIVAAGNHAKLMSSLHWVRPSDSLTFEESVLAHLLGLRLCLWPWRSDFMDVEDNIDTLLSDCYLTTNMKLLLKGRLSSQEIFVLHSRLEHLLLDNSVVHLWLGKGFTISPVPGDDGLDQVLEQFDCLIKDFIDQIPDVSNTKQTDSGTAQSAEC